MRYVSHWPSLTPLLFLAVYLPTGTHLGRGFRKLSAYIRGRVRGTRTPATAITVGCSSFLRRGNPWAARRSRALRARVSSYTGHGSSTDVTATRGVNGGQPERAA